MDHFCHEPRAKNGFVRWLKVIAIMAVLLAITAAYHWTPLARWIPTNRLDRWAGMAGDKPLVILAISGGFIIGGLLFVPVTVMISTTALILPPWQSFGCALTGAVLNATVTYLLGRCLNKATIQRVTGPKIERLQKYLVRRDILTVVFIRNLPIAPYSMVNLVAGASGIQYSHFLIGTIVGMLPGIAVITLFTNRALRVFHNPTLINIVVAVGIAMLIGLGFWWLRRRIRRHSI